MLREREREREGGKEGRKEGEREREREREKRKKKKGGGGNFCTVHLGRLASSMPFTFYSFIASCYAFIFWPCKVL